MTKSEQKELRTIVDKLEVEATCAKLHFNYLKKNMINDQIDQIKNCEVGLPEARQMLRAIR